MLKITTANAKDFGSKVYVPGFGNVVFFAKTTLPDVLVTIAGAVVADNITHVSFSKKKMTHSIREKHTKVIVVVDTWMDNREFFVDIRNVKGRVW